MYEIVKKFLDEGGKCLLIEDGKPIGVVLTMEEYDKFKETKETKKESSELLISDINTNDIKENPIPALRSEVGGREQLLIPRTNSNQENSENLIGEAIAKKIDFPEASANIDEINLADAGDVTLEDLGLDELPY